MLTSGLLLISTGSSRIFHWYFLCALKISTLSLLIGGGFAGPGWAQSRINCDNPSCTGTVIEDATDNDDRIAEDGMASDNSPFTSVTDTKLTYGTYRVFVDNMDPYYAVWQYEIDNSDPQTDALGAGETGTDRFTVTVADGGSVTVTITVTGADDAAVIAGDLTGSAIEDDTSAQTATGTVTVSDPDSPTTITTQTTSGTYGSLVLRADGTWTYTLDNTLPATNALADGATETDSFSIATSDGSTATISITVTGADDASVIGGTLTGSVTEDGTSEQTTATGTVTVSDPDSPTTITAQTASGTYGSLVLRADGTWTYTLDDARTATNALADGATETDSFLIATSDGSTATISITVTGADDASVIGGTLTGSVTEDDTQTATGTVTMSDPDSTTTITAQTSVDGTYGSFSIDTDGTWTYTLDDARTATNALADGATATDSFSIATSDGSTATISITVTGADDASVIGGTLTGSVTEDDTQTATGTVTVSDPDSTTTITTQTTSGTYGSLVLRADGTWTYTLNNTLPATNALTEGATATDSFPIATSDGSTATISITVMGANDAAVIAGTLTGSVIEDDSSAQRATGTVTVTDVDGTNAVRQNSNIVGVYGTLAITSSDGIWTYTLDNTLPATNALTEGATATDTLTILAADGTEGTVTITVTGANDAAVIGGDLTGSVIEDDTSAQTATGTVTVSDPDSPTTITAQTTSGTYGSLVLRADGTWTYTLDNTLPATNALAEGATATDTLTILAADGTEGTVTITVTGAGDPGVIEGTLRGAVTENDISASSASGTVMVTDVDGATITAQTSVGGTYGSFSIDTDGTWTYTLDNTLPATNALAEGATATDNFPIATSDGSTATISITVMGTNDAAVIAGTLTGSVIEDDTSAQTATGTVTVTDVDGTNAVRQNSNIVGVYGTLAITSSDGTWTYTLDNTLPATNALAEGVTETDTLTILAADGTEGMVSIMVTGADDAAVIGGTLTGSVIEDDTSAQTATGTVTVSDPDGPTTITAQTTSGIYGSLVLRADGTWTYTLDNTRPATNALAEGATATDTLTILAADGTEGTVTITVTGAGDPGLIEGTLRGAVTENDISASSASGTVMVTDVDGATITAQTSVDGTYGSFSIETDGTWTYALDNTLPATNALTEGATATDSFPITTSDGSTATISITVMGTNDAAVIGGTLTGSVTEDNTSAQTATGTVTVTDVDGTNAVRQNSNIVGVYGTLAIRSSDGTWTYTLDNTLPATNALEEGVTATDTLTILAADGTEGMVTITVTGADDAAVIGGDLTGSVIEDDTSAQTATGTVTVSDPDSPTTITAQTTSGTYGSLVLRADGKWTYTLDNTRPATNALAEGATATDTLTILAADGTEGTVTITVTGAGDPGVIEGTLQGAVTENERSASSASGTVMVTDVDGATITAQTSVDGTYGSFSIETDGTWTYTLDNTRPATNALAEGATATDSFPIAASDGSTATISITVMGGNDAAVIGGTLTGSVIEDDTSAQTATGTVTVTDVDGTNAVRQNSNIVGVYGTLAIRSSDGVWIYTLDNTLPATNALAEGATATDTLTILAADGTEGMVTITITGAGDPGLIEGTLRGAVTENDISASSASGTVMVTDVGGATITAQTTRGTYGSLVLRADGTWTYTLDNTLPATNALAEGATATDSFPIAASDGSTAMIRITVMGANDAAVIGGTLTGSVIEDDTSAQTATGTVTVTDVDGTNAVRQNLNIVGVYGTLAITSSDGVWIYTLDNTLPATNALADGATATDTLTILAADGTEGTVTITVTGAGDPGLIEGTLRGAVTADDISASSASGTVMVTDVDGATITAQTSDGTYGSFSIDTDGTWTYTLNNDDPDTDALIRGETGTETFTIMASDGTTATVTITVTGASMSVAGVMVTPQALEVTETAGESQADVYTVVLRERPSGDVIITPTSADPSVATVSGGPLVFRQDNWYQPQSVTVTGVDDTVVEPDGRMTEITHTISGGGYDNVAVASVTVTVTDDDDPERNLDEVNKEIVPSIVNEVARRQIAIITGRLETISSGPPMGNLSMEEVVTDVADYLFSHHQDIQANGFDWRQALSGNSFSFALANTSVSQGSMDMDDGDSSSSSSGPMSFWGGIDYSSLEDKIEGFDLYGGITSFDFGVDKEFRSDLVAGVLLSITNSEFDLTQGSTDSTYEVDIATVNPYISWEASEDLSLWASVGYGRGQADLTDDSTNDTVSKSGDFTRFSAGGRFQLWQSEAGAALALKLDGTTANFLDADIQNIRLATELSHGFSIESGALNTALELGLLMSSADESAAELAGRLHWQGDAGFSASARSRVLLAGGDRKEWGIGGALRYTTGGAGEGFMMSLEPSFGISNPQLLSDLWSAPRSDLAITTEAPTARLNAKLAYGFPTSDGLLTPYTDLSFSETTSIYGTGLRYGLPTGLDLNLKGMRKTSTTDAVENTILLELRSDL